MNTMNFLKAVDIMMDDLDQFNVSNSSLLKPIHSRQFDITIPIHIQHHLMAMNVNRSVWDSDMVQDFQNIYQSLATETSKGQPSNSTVVYDDVPTGIVILLSFLYGSVSVVAVVGNALVMWVVATSRKMHSVTNYFIANLALADIIIGLFAIPFQFQAALLQRWLLPWFMCPFCPFVKTVSVNVSVFTLTAIAVDRYRAILHPLHPPPSKVRSKILLLFIWVFSILLSVPMSVALRVHVVDDDRGGMKPMCDAINMDEVAYRNYTHTLVALQYFLPLGIISFAYIRIGWELWISQTPGNAEGSRDAHVLRNKKKVIKMLFIVVLMFALCWMPLQMYHVLEVIFTTFNEYEYIHYIWFISNWLAMSNSCCNPFIYAIYNEKFKREFRQKFRWLLRDTGNVEVSDIEQSPYQASLRYPPLKRLKLSPFPDRLSHSQGRTLNGSFSNTSSLTRHSTLVSHDTRSSKGVDPRWYSMKQRPMTKNANASKRQENLTISATRNSCVNDPLMPCEDFYTEHSDKDTTL